MKKLVLAGIAVSLLSSANAQTFYISPAFENSVSTSIKNRNDEVSTSSLGIEAGNENFFLGYTSKDYSFDKRKDLDNLKHIYGGFGYTGALSDSVMFNLSLRASLAWDHDFKASQSYNLAPYGTLLFLTDNRLTIAAGGGAFVCAPKKYFFPVLMLRYSDIRENGLSGAAGFPENFVSYRFNERFALLGRVNFKYGSCYYLGEKSSAFEHEKIYLIDNSITISAGTIINPLENIEVRGDIEYSLKRNLNFYNSHGDKIEKFETDNELSFRISGSVFF